MRIRTIKPEWLTDEFTALASDAARVATVALILLADDFGNGRANETMLGSQIFPGDPGKIPGVLRELRKMGFLELYEVRGQRYYSIRNWRKHQRVDKPGNPRVPPPSEASENFPGSPANVHSRPATDQDQDHDQDRDQKNSTPQAAAAVVFAAWVEALVDPRRRSACRLTDKRRRLIKARLRDGYDVQTMLDAIDGIQKSPFHMGDNDRNQRYTGFEFIFRDGGHVEKFAAMKDSPPPRPKPKFRNVTPIATTAQIAEAAKDNESEFARFEKR